MTTAQRHELQQVILEHLAAEGRPEDIPGLHLGCFLFFRHLCTTRAPRQMRQMGARSWF